MSTERKRERKALHGPFLCIQTQQHEPILTLTHTQHIFKTIQLWYVFYTAPVERKGLFPSVAVKSLIVIIIIQKCEPPSTKMIIIKET